MDQAGFQRAIDAIYATAGAPQKWTAALKELEIIFRCSAAKLVDRNLETMAGRGFGFDEASEREFFGIWRHRNILASTAHLWRLKAVTDRQVLARSDFLSSDYWNGFLRPRGSHSFLMLSLRSTPAIHTSITLTRPYSVEEHDAHELDFANALLPHLQRAIAISYELQGASLFAKTAGRLIEDNPTAIVVIDSAGNIQFANRAARDVDASGDAIRFRDNRLEALRPTDDAKLQALVGTAVALGDQRTLGRGGMMRLPRKSGRRDYNIVFVPLARDNALLDPFTAACCVLIGDPDRAPVSPRAMLKALYGLTAMEVKVAERIMTGESPEQMAQGLSIKVSTVRDYLAAVFRKTGTNRQSDLLRLLLSLPSRDADH